MASTSVPSASLSEAVVTTTAGSRVSAVSLDAALSRALEGAMPRLASQLWRLSDDPLLRRRGQTELAKGPLFQAQRLGLPAQQFLCQVKDSLLLNLAYLGIVLG